MRNKTLAALLSATLAAGPAAPASALKAIDEGGGVHVGSQARSLPLAIDSTSFRALTDRLFPACVKGNGLKTLEELAQTYPEARLLAALAEQPDLLKSVELNHAVSKEALARWASDIRAEAIGRKQFARLSAIAAGQTAIEAAFDGGAAKPNAALPPGTRRINEDLLRPAALVIDDAPGLSPAQVWTLGDAAAKPRVHAITARGGDVLINAKPARRIWAKSHSDGWAAETFIHPDDPGLLVKIYSHPASLAGFEKKNSKLESLGPLSETGAAARIVEHGEAAVAGQGKVYFLVQELVDGLKLRDLPPEDWPQAALAQLFDRLEASGLALTIPGPGQEWLLANVMIGKTASGGPAAYLIDGSAKAAPAQALAAHYEMARSLLSQIPIPEDGAPAQPEAEAGKLRELGGGPGQLLVKPAAGKTVAAILEKHGVSGPVSFVSESPAYALLTLGAAEQARELAAKLAADEDVAVVRAHPDVRKAVEETRLAQLKERQDRERALSAQRQLAERTVAEPPPLQLPPVAQLAGAVLRRLETFIAGQPAQAPARREPRPRSLAATSAALSSADASKLARTLVDPQASEDDTHSASKALEALLNDAPDHSQLDAIESVLRLAIDDHLAKLGRVGWDSDREYADPETPPESAYAVVEGAPQPPRRVRELLDRYLQLAETRPDLVPAAVTATIEKIFDKGMRWASYYSDGTLRDRVSIDGTALQLRLWPALSLTALAQSVYRSHPDYFPIEDLLGVVNAIDVRKSELGYSNAASPFDAMRETFAKLLVDRSLASWPAVVLDLKIDKDLLRQCLILRLGIVNGQATSELSDFALEDLLRAYATLREPPTKRSRFAWLLPFDMSAPSTREAIVNEQAAQLYRERFIQGALADPRKAWELVKRDKSADHKLLLAELLERSEFKTLALLANAK